MIKIHQRLFLSFILVTLLFGLAAHAAPDISLCDCTDVPNNGEEAPALDICLVCQLQLGVQVSTALASLPIGISATIADLACPSSREHARQIPHPPNFS